MFCLGAAGGIPQLGFGEIHPVRNLPHGDAVVQPRSGGAPDDIRYDTDSAHCALCGVRMPG